MPTDQTSKATVKTEMGSYKRMPTFRAPRDLKLTQFRDLPTGNAAADGKPKKTFVPNLNVNRRRADDGARSKDGDAPRSDSRERGRGGDERGRGRGRRSREFIQQSGVFSQGLAPSLKPSPWQSKNFEGSASLAGIAKPKLKLNENLRVNKEEEEEIMKDLLRDDFVEGNEIEADLDNAPVELPLQDCCKWESLKEEKPTFGESLPLACGYSSTVMKGVTVKPDPEDENAVKVNGVTKPLNVQHMRPLSLSELLAISEEKNFLFFQIPHRLPNLRMNVNPAVQKRPGDRQAEEEGSGASVLRNLPQGRIGTLQMRKSGRAVLVLGDVKLNVEPGTQSAFKQDLISVNLENSTKSGNMINMGSISTRVLVTPHWKHLLNHSS